jgi:hypothetical protein
VAGLLDRARQLVAGGPHSPNVSELIAVHALLYPSRDPVCDHCPAEQGRAYYAIQRWVNQQENSSLTISSSNVKKGTTARFHSDELIYTPHGLGVAYSNANLTDKAARNILAADPDAAQHFSVLPPKAEDGEDEQPQNASQAAATEAVEKAEQNQFVPAGFDYAKLASAMLDEVQRRQAEAEAKQNAQDDDDDEQADDEAETENDEAETEVKTEVVGNVEVTTGHTDGTEADHTDEQPVRLSRMNKEQLLTTYRTELRMEPAAGLNNDELRNAIAEHRASQQDPE